ncbi:phosphoribosylglycinamide formyltransferase [bacterium]|nr:phosphoribosylglycinamide formyltransferase [Candidatus Neomarinimicrobiota bacterium]MCK5684096.1 phosphoribosylglycinamide formyltransferase [bacterium]
MKKNIAVFASGAGTNFIEIYKILSDEMKSAEFKLLISNNPQAPILEKAQKLGITYEIFKRNDHATYHDYSESILNKLIENKINIIILAGYMVKLPKKVVQQYENNIVNIHPALLPSFGGKGYYGKNVHEAVIHSGVKISGITIHFVNNDYDKGNIILQKTVEIDVEDDAESLAKKVLKLEHYWYPRIVKKLCENKIKNIDGKIKIYE